MRQVEIVDAKGKKNDKLHHLVAVHRYLENVTEN